MRPTSNGHPGGQIRNYLEMGVVQGHAVADLAHLRSCCHLMDHDSRLLAGVDEHVIGVTADGITKDGETDDDLLKVDLITGALECARKRVGGWAQWASAGKHREVSTWAGRWGGAAWGGRRWASGWTYLRNLDGEDDGIAIVEELGVGRLLCGHEAPYSGEASAGRRDKGGVPRGEARRVSS